MAVAGVGGAGSSVATGNRFSELSSEEFIRIITAELTRQDPLKPNDTNNLLQQISGIRDIESQLKLTDSLDSLVKQNSFASASGLIGAQVSGVSETNARISGVVASVSQTLDGPVLTLLSGQRVRFSNVDEVSVPRAPSGGTNTGTAPNPGTTTAPASQTDERATSPTVPGVQNNLSVEAALALDSASAAVPAR
jgi:flagellar basal-body rod modification protein FlgD